jgi:hypothetical protein
MSHKKRVFKKIILKKCAHKGGLKKCFPRKRWPVTLSNKDGKKIKIRRTRKDMSKVPPETLFVLIIPEPIPRNIKKKEK